MKPTAALVSAAGLLSAVLSSSATAQQAPLKIGVLSDFSAVYSRFCDDTRVDGNSHRMIISLIRTSVVCASNCQNGRGEIHINA